ncbi:hypothetical protein ISF_00588 [Cordyceps fumosorosea ARSEF 2679]|uniref:Uncharacterized protein n=1 Tax=Cordyceps fumosorosea (strain ARSEF 2679) TaxID=1081104 RepID=A0A168EDL8_CORFA|nr:hypothetical protein ISF_00588 [Cordyceps fumosorosea ARSEF 2679]OAA73687.1 hypothetical protein ISF_00588 [Cordyceps fumosorosea ARSEF 2679]
MKVCSTLFAVAGPLTQAACQRDCAAAPVYYSVCQVGCAQLFNSPDPELPVAQVKQSLRWLHSLYKPEPEWSNA